MLVAISGVRVIVNSRFATVVVRRSIGVRIRGNIHLCFVNVCRRLVIGQTMCNASKCDRGVRRKHAKCVKRGDTERRTDTKSPPQHSAHRVIKNESEEASEYVSAGALQLFIGASVRKFESAFEPRVCAPLRSEEDHAVFFGRGVRNLHPR